MFRTKNLCSWRALILAFKGTPFWPLVAVADKVRA